MNFTVNAECTPEEARRFIGLPDLSPVHDAYVARMKRVVEEGVNSGDVESMMRNWAPMSEAGFAMWRQMIDKVGTLGGK